MRDRHFPVGDALRGMGYLIGIPLFLVGLGAWLPDPPDPLGMVVRLLLVAAAMLLGLRLLRGATALAFGLASLVTLLLFELPLGFYAERLYQQASGLTVFMILLFGAVLFLLGRQDLLDRQARRPPALAADPARINEEERRLDQEVDVLCVLRQFAGWVQGVTRVRLIRGLLLLPLVLINFVSSVTTALLFKSLWAPTRRDFTQDAVGRAQAAGILCLCTTGVLVVFTPAFSSTWWLFFSGMATGDWMPDWPLGIWLYALLSYAHGYWLLSRASEPAPVPVAPEQRRLRWLYLLLLGSAVLALTLAFTGLMQQQVQSSILPETLYPSETTSQPAETVMPTQAQTSPHQDQAVSDRAAQAKATQLGVCTLLLGLAVALLMAQGWLYRFHLPAASERWNAVGFWSLLLDGMRGVFTTVVLLVVILAFKDVVLGALPAAQDTAPSGAAAQVLLSLLAIGVTLLAGLGLGSSWGAFALGFMVLQLGGVSPQPALTQILILLAAFCNQRSPRADNVLNLIGAEHATGAAVTAVWSVPSFELPYRDRRLAVRAEWVQWGLLGLGVMVALAQSIW